MAPYVVELSAWSAIDSLILMAGLISMFGAILLGSILCGCCRDGEKKHEQASGPASASRGSGKNEKVSKSLKGSDSKTSNLSPPQEMLIDSSARSVKTISPRFESAPSFILSSHKIENSDSPQFKVAMRPQQKSLAAAPSLQLMSNSPRSSKRNRRMQNCSVKKATRHQHKITTKKSPTRHKEHKKLKTSPVMVSMAERSTTVVAEAENMSRTVTVTGKTM